MPKDDSNWGALLGVGFEMAVGILAGVFVGLWIDRKFGWSPWGMVVCTLLGTAGGMYLLIRQGMRSMKDPLGPKQSGPKAPGPGQ